MGVSLSVVGLNLVLVLAASASAAPSTAAVQAVAQSSTATAFSSLSILPVAPRSVTNAASAPKPLSSDVRTSALAARPPFAASTVRLLGSFGTSPLRLDYGDVLWLAPSVAAAWITLHNDLPIYHALATGSARKTWLDHSMPTVSAMGEGLTEAGLVAVASQLGSPRLAQTSAEAMQALIVAGIYVQIFKFAAWSNRPYENDTGHYFWDYKQSTQGMPSGHSFSAFAVAEVYGEEYGREWTYPVAALIAYSRIYNNAHWPSDVVVGSILGIIDGYQTRHAALLNGVGSLSFGVGEDQGAPEVVAHERF